MQFQYIYVHFENFATIFFSFPLSLWDDIFASLLSYHIRFDLLCVCSLTKIVHTNTLRFSGLQYFYVFLRGCKNAIFHLTFSFGYWRNRKSNRSNFMVMSLSLPKIIKTKLIWLVDQSSYLHDIRYIYLLIFRMIPFSMPNATIWRQSYWKSRKWNDHNRIRNEFHFCLLTLTICGVQCLRVQ